MARGQAAKPVVQAAEPRGAARSPSGRFWQCRRGGNGAGVVEALAGLGRALEAQNARLAMLEHREPDRMISRRPTEIERLIRGSDTDVRQARGAGRSGCYDRSSGCDPSPVDAHLAGPSGYLPTGVGHS